MSSALTTESFLLGSEPSPSIAPEPEKNTKAREFIQVYGNGSHAEAGVFLRSDLGPGHTIDGPAVILQQDCTTCILLGYDAVVDDFGNLLIQRKDN